MFKHKIKLSLVIALLIIAGVRAQTPTSYILRTYNQGAPSPIQSFTFQATATTCNQNPVQNPNTVNPTRVEWNDVANAGKVCIWIDNGSGPLFSVPTPGTYEGTLAASNTGGTSAESARSPFSRVAIPAVPTGVVILQ